MKSTSKDVAQKCATPRSTKFHVKSTSKDVAQKCAMPRSTKFHLKEMHEYGISLYI